MKPITVNQVKPNKVGPDNSYMMFYLGPCYPLRNNIEAYAKKQGFTHCYFGTDEGTGFQHMYNGDTLVVYKDADLLPNTMKADALIWGEEIA